MTDRDFFDSQSRPIFQEAPGVAALEYLASLRDVWAKGSLNAGHDETVNNFANGQVAMMPQWFAFYALLKKPSGGLGDRLGVGLMPGVRSDSGSIRRAPSIGGGSLGISANSANVEAAWEFVKFMTSRKIMAEAALDGEIITRKSAYDNPEVLKRNPASQIYRQSLDLSKFRPRSTAYAAIESAIGEGVSRALAGETSAAQALADAARTVQELNANAQ
jgi:multiple sugar transport system substrate-binding protein